MDISPDQIHQMAFEEGQPADTGDGYLFTAEEFDLFVERLLTAAVPPAGDVEVLAYQYSQAKGEPWPHTQTLRQRGLIGQVEIELVDRAHVTRLTAELNNVRDLLKELARHPSMSFHQIALVEAIVSEVEKPGSQL